MGSQTIRARYRRRGITRIEARAGRAAAAVAFAGSRPARMMRVRIVATPLELVRALIPASRTRAPFTRTHLPPRFAWTVSR
jgi:hypothetical protein